MDINELIEKYSLPSPPAEAHYTVYKLTDPAGKVYIGCTGMIPKKRWRKRYTKNTPIRKAIDKFGWENFEKEILCENLTREGAEKLERWFIANYDSANPQKGYNCALGGMGKGVCMNEETKKRYSLAKIRQYENDPDYRERVKKGIQEAYRKDPGYRERVRQVRKMAFENDPDCWKKMRLSRKRIFEEHPEKKMEISRRMKEYVSKPENRAFIDSDKRAKPMICIETGEYFPSQYAAAKATGLNMIHNVCEKKAFTSGGYHWRYATSDENAVYLKGKDCV